MKPWLLNILACPICKEHPLTVYVLDAKPNQLEEADRLAEELVSHHQKGVLSEPSLEPIHNLSTAKMVEDRLATARKAFAALSKKTPTPDAMRPLVDYFHGVEILEAALQCPKCNRWFPVGSRIPGIPELLPDGVREQKADVKFLQKHKAHLPKSLLEESPPFTVKGNKVSPESED